MDDARQTRQAALADGLGHVVLTKDARNDGGKRSRPSFLVRERIFDWTFSHPPNGGERQRQMPSPVLSPVQRVFHFPIFDYTWMITQNRLWTFLSFGLIVAMASKKRFGLLPEIKESR